MASGTSTTNSTSSTSWSNRRRRSRAPSAPPSQNAPDRVSAGNARQKLSGAGARLGQFLFGFFILGREAGVVGRHGCNPPLLGAEIERAPRPSRCAIRACHMHAMFPSAERAARVQACSSAMGRQGVADTLSCTQLHASCTRSCTMLLGAGTSAFGGWSQPVDAPLGLTCNK